MKILIVLKREVDWYKECYIVLSFFFGVDLVLHQTLNLVFVFKNYFLFSKTKRIREIEKTYLVFRLFYFYL